MRGTIEAFDGNELSLQSTDGAQFKLTLTDEKIYELVWPEDRIAHIAEHNVHPEEVEEICFDRPFIQRAKSFGKNPAYYVLGRTTAGRYLFCVVIEFPDGRGYPVTARPMTPKEKRRFDR